MKNRKFRTKKNGKFRFLNLENSSKKMKKTENLDF